ncbi:MAG: hypothetical protein IH899_05710, partial [Planctomycetes bacterium]|nr:hypothetical protein [Planctomycetota bacterium]
MKRLFIGNYDFEHQLSAAGRWEPPVSIRRLNEELACVWIAIAGDGDFIRTPALVEATFFEEMAAVGLPDVRPVTNKREITEPVEVVPWGWTEEIRHRADQQGWNYSAPPQTVVTEANSRRFSFQCEQEWNIGLEEAAVIDSVETLAEAIRRLPRGDDRWVVKAEFSMSARERVLGQGRELPEQTLHWAQKRIERDGVVFFEPWIDCISEAGLQFTIPKTGDLVFEGVTPLLTGERGEYRGNRFSVHDDIESIWSSCIETAHQIAQKLQAKGYFGPLGIDAVQYRDRDGELHVRPLQDINARYTMGRLALGFRRLLQPGETGSWLHYRQPDTSIEELKEWFADIQQRLPARTKVIRTSPWEVNGKPVRHGTVVLICSSQ